MFFNSARKSDTEIEIYGIMNSYDSNATSSAYKRTVSTNDLY